MSAEPSDEIDDLVNWQLSRRGPLDVITSICRVCLAQWTGEATTCPECGVVQ